MALAREDAIAEIATRPLAAPPRLRLYACHQGNATTFRIMQPQHAWHGARDGASHLHALLRDVDPVTAESLEDSSERTRVPLCLDFDLRGARDLAALTHSERAAFLCRHHAALRALCVLGCHALWLERCAATTTNRDDDVCDIVGAGLDTSPFLVPGAARVFVSSSSGPCSNNNDNDDGDYKLSTHVVVRLRDAAWSGIASSQALAEWLNALVADRALPSNNACVLRLRRLACAMIPNSAAPDVAPFDIQIYKSRSLRMLYSLTRASDRPLLPCDDADVTLHDPWHATAAEMSSEALILDFAPPASAHTSTLATNHIRRDFVFPHLPPDKVQRLLVRILEHTLLSALRHHKVTMKHASKLARDWAALMRMRRILLVHPPATTTGDAVATSVLQIETGIRFCPFKHARTITTNPSVHTSRSLCLELCPPARQPCWPRRALPHARLACFSHNCARFCDTRANYARHDALAPDRSILAALALLLGYSF